MRGAGVVGFAGGLGGSVGSHGFHFPPFLPFVPYRTQDLVFGALLQPRRGRASAPFQQPGYLPDLQGSLREQPLPQVQAKGPGGRRGPTAVKASLDIDLAGKLS